MGNGEAEIHGGYSPLGVCLWMLWSMRGLRGPEVPAVQQVCHSSRNSAAWLHGQNPSSRPWDVIRGVKGVGKGCGEQGRPLHLWRSSAARCFAICCRSWKATSSSEEAPCPSTPKVCRAASMAAASTTVPPVATARSVEGGRLGSTAEEVAVPKVLATTTAHATGEGWGLWCGCYRL